jgi:uncharacterized protein
MPNPIAHFEICVKDLKAGTDFYRELFGWTIKMESTMNYAMIDTGKEPGGGIFQAEGDIKPYLAIYPEVDDIEKTLEKAEKLGAFIIVKKTKISDEWGYYGLFTDPDGNVIGVWSRK